MHFYKLLACLALISSAFVCVVVHVTQKGTNLVLWWPLHGWGYGLAPLQLGIWIGPFQVGVMDQPLSSWGYAEHVEEMERKTQECIDAGLVLEYKKGEYPSHCPPCLLYAWWSTMGSLTNVPRTTQHGAHR